MEKQLVHNSVTCLECGETLVSFHTHDYKTHLDVNGEEYIKLF